MKALLRIGAVLLVTFFSVTTADANSLVNTTPISGSTVTMAPSSVTLSVQNPLSDLGNEISVTDPKGVRVDDGALTINGTDAVIGLKKLVEPGFYTVKYSLITDNDVPLVGQYVFNFDAPTEIASPEPSSIASTKTQSSSNFGTTIFVLFILFTAIVVLIVLSLYARKLYRER
ncbi:MAG: hypothetical protein RLZ57_1058 [Actinomycetota bacterium]|jgi:methionine-rich copper-binding protein CopC